MTDKQALARARKLLGKAAYIEKRKDAVTGDTRGEACAALAALQATKPDRADREAFRRWRVEEERLRLVVWTYRCAVGTTHALPGLGWPVRTVEGWGDDWDAALAVAAERRG